MNLARALRLSSPLCLALTGAGGKTTALFQLARQLPSPVLVTTSTHLHVDQIRLADRHLTAPQPEDLAVLEKDRPPDVVLVTGPPEGDRVTALDFHTLNWLHELRTRHTWSLLIEADGARQKPLKAPADHEPVIPGFVDAILVVAGLSGLGTPLSTETVHRPEAFSALSGLPIGAPVSVEALAHVLAHPSGGLKGIPPGAKRLALLNQAGQASLLAAGGRLAEALLGEYECVVLGSLREQRFQVFENVAGIVLAAREAKRFGRPKQLLDWHGQPFVRHVAATALAAGLSPVIVVTGAAGEQVEAALAGLPVLIARNPDWPSGQSSSLRGGLSALPSRTGAAVFLLADQPQVPATLLRALVSRHRQDLPAIVAPLVNDRRANPVLFDRITFPDLQALRGDIGGRAIFSKHPVTYLPWQDESLLADIDLPEDYEKLAGR